jgi:hypothetical protein
MLGYRRRWNDCVRQWNSSGGGHTLDSLRGAGDVLVSKLDAAGAIQWTHLLGGSRLDGYNARAWPTQDGGYLVGCSSFSPRSGDKSQGAGGASDYWVVKLSATGQKQWDRTLATNTDDSFGQAWQTIDGGYVLVGATGDGPANGDKSHANHGGNDGWVVKLSAMGQVLWDRTLGGSGEDSLLAGAPTADGGSILVGLTDSPADGDVSQPTPVPAGNTVDGWVIKLDVNGATQWDRRLGGGENDYFTAVQQTLDGGYLVGGPSESGISGDHSQSSRGGADYWAIKLTGTGAKQWDRRFGTAADDYLQAVAEAANGELLLGGHTAGGLDGDKSQTSQGGQDVWVVRLTAAGGALRDHRYGGLQDDLSHNITAFPNGDVAFAALSRSGISGDKTQTVSSKDGWVVRCNALGTLVWERTIGSGSDELQQALLQTADKGYFVGGQTDAEEGPDFLTPLPAGASGDGSSWWLLKRDSLGVAQWDTIIGNGRITRLRGLDRTANGGLLVTGSTTDTDSNRPGTRDADFLLMRLDARNRVSLGLQQFGGTGDDWLGEARTTSDNAAALAGTSRSGIGREKSQASRGGADFWLLKLTMGFTRQWDRCYGGTGLDSLVSMRQTADGGYILAGSTTSPISGELTETSRGGADYWLVKVSSLGVVQWQHRYGGPGHDWLASARPTPDGGYILLGTTFSGIGGEVTQVSRGGRDLWVVKVSSLGVLQWQRRYGGSGQEYAATLEVDPDGGYILGASTTSPVSGEVTQASRGGTDYWLLRISLIGTPSWDQRLGGSGEDVLTCLATTRGYGYAVGGQSNSPTASGEHQQANKGGYDYWTLVLGARRVPLATTPAGAGQLAIYPNPARTTATVWLPSLPGARAATLTITDALGRVRRTENVALAAGSQRHELSLTGLAPGLYALRVQAGGTALTQRLVVE